MELIENPHIGILSPSEAVNCKLIRGSYFYYHYFCDGIKDSGWGCGYRTLQTICSWMKKQINDTNPQTSISSQVPSIAEIQKILVDIGDKTPDFQGSHQWIGSVEVSYCLEYLYKIQCRIIHARNTEDLKMQTKAVFDHFHQYGSPIMMGGDKDCSSKGILGISETRDGIYLLILDPHFHGHKISKEKIQSDGWIKWQNIDFLNHSSFYNLCCPLIKANT